MLMIIASPSFSRKLRFQNVSRRKRKAAVSNSFSLKSVFKLTLRFRDGLLWTVGLTVEIKLRFQIYLASCGRYSSPPVPASKN